MLQSWVKDRHQPQNAEELKAQLEEDMLTAHAEEERYTNCHNFMFL
jgi:hypothetical protein